MSYNENQWLGSILAQFRIDKEYTNIAIVDESFIHIVQLSIFKFVLTKYL